MAIDWTQAPGWANYHTTDMLGKTWWSHKPRLQDSRYYLPEVDSGAEYYWYDQRTCAENTIEQRPAVPESSTEA